MTTTAVFGVLVRWGVAEGEAAGVCWVVAVGVVAVVVVVVVVEKEEEEPKVEGVVDDAMVLVEVVVINSL